jgi:hypothetical protein
LAKRADASAFPAIFAGEMKKAANGGGGFTIEILCS